MIGARFETTALQCHTKWRNLLRSYRICKDNIGKTGMGPTKFNVFEKMDDILGKKPTNNCAHTVESSAAFSENTLGDEDFQDLDTTLKG